MGQSSWKNRHFVYNQETEYRDLKREILDGQIYYFQAAVEDPIIIDGGAHIGLASVYFKWLYPHAHLWAFEPNPELFALLEDNIKLNDLTDVTLVNAALGKHTGEAKFFVDATDWQWWSVGSLRAGAWNGQQKVQKEITVKSVKLSDFVQNLSRVDLLKLDIEGAESTVLHSLRGQLDKVARLIFEFHPTREQKLSELLAFLAKRGFQTQLKDRKNHRLTSWHEGELVLVEAWR